MKKAISTVLIAAMLLAGIGFAIAEQSQGSTQMVDVLNGSTVKIPPAPPKQQPNMQYGNNARAAIIGERLSDAAQGNAKVYISEDGVITARVNLYQDVSPYDIAGTMANLTYMLADLYSLTDRAKSDLAVQVYDTSNNLIIDAKFNNAKNAFEYFKVPASATPSTPSVTAQPGRRQPGAGGRQPIR